MRRFVSASFVTVVALVHLAGSAHAATPQLELRERRLAPGSHQVVVSLYEAAEGGVPVATETRTIEVEPRGRFVLHLGALAAALTAGERWLAVRVPPGLESRRIPLTNASPGDVTVHVLPDPVITANGIIESTVSGFRFPDATVQTTAAVPQNSSPSAVSTTGSSGTAPTFSRSDHIHPHGDLTGGTLHASATTVTSGFLSATDKVKLDGLPSYARTIVVSGGGTASANGTALLNALAGISGNSSTSPYLLKIEPGLYDLVTNQLVMKSYVDIEGSGENATFITTARTGATITSAAAVIVGAANSELRNLTASITNYANAYCIGYFAAGTGGTMRLRDVTINASGGQTHSYGVYGTTSASLSLFHVTVNATQWSGANATGLLANISTTADIRSSTITAKSSGSAQGILTGCAATSSNANVTIDSSTISATGSVSTSYGVYVSSGTMTVTGSTTRVDTAPSRYAALTAATDLAYLKISSSRVLAFTSSFTSSSFLSVSKGATSTLIVATSEIDSPSAGSPKCVHVYDDAGDDLNNACPVPIG